jgi:two-component system, OmpR family, response regulator ResD
MAEPAFEAGPTRESAPARILVIDDDPVVRRIVADMLARLGYQVTEATRPEEALANLGDPELRLVISDIVMPGRFCSSPGPGPRRTSPKRLRGARPG